MKAVLEGLLFLVGDEGISFDEIKQVLEATDEEVSKTIEDLISDYETNERGLKISKYGNLYKLTTKMEYKDYYKKLSEISSIRNLSQSALETLAIIAYNSPITRARVDELRGISSAQMIRNLVAKDFIQEVGRSDGIGRAILYGVTDAFLDYFGLSSIDDLPKMELIPNDTSETVDLYKSKYNDIEEVIEDL